MRLIRTTAQRVGSKFEVKAGDFTVLHSRPDYAKPFLVLFDAILRDGGTLGFWLWEPPEPLERVTKDQHIQPVIVDYLAIGGVFAAKLIGPTKWEPNFLWVPSDMSQLCKVDVEAAIESDKWVGIWPVREDAFGVSLPPKGDVGENQDVTDKLFPQIESGSDVVLMAVHDGNPLCARCTPRGRDALMGWLEEVEAALQGDPWIRQHGDQFIWNQEYWTWDLPGELER